MHSIQTYSTVFIKTTGSYSEGVCIGILSDTANCSPKIVWYTSVEFTTGVVQSLSEVSVGDTVVDLLQGSIASLDLLRG